MLTDTLGHFRLYILTSSSIALNFAKRLSGVVMLSVDASNETAAAAPTTFAAAAAASRPPRFVSRAARPL
jgi:hypothetical protein